MCRSRLAESSVEWWCPKRFGHGEFGSRTPIWRNGKQRVKFYECPGAVSRVWLFFENSTGCLISQCQLSNTPAGLPRSVEGVGGRFLWQLFNCRDAFPKILLESLILAQDERWRRA